MPKKCTTVASRKAKGRNACQEVKEILHTFAPELEDGDILVTSSSVTGKDLNLSPKAMERYPIVIEVKCQEALNIWSAIKQAESHLEDGEGFTPVVFFKRNFTKTYVAIDAIRFVSLLASRTEL